MVGIPGANMPPIAMGMGIESVGIGIVAEGDRPGGIAPPIAGGPAFGTVVLMLLGPLLLLLLLLPLLFSLLLPVSAAAFSEASSVAVGEAEGELAAMSPGRPETPPGPS